jgi:hypothetical protein
MNGRDDDSGSTRGLSGFIVFGVALCLVILLAVVVWQRWENKPLEPGQLFVRCYERIQDDMPEQEVHAMFSGFTSAWKEEAATATKHGKPLKRPSTFEVTYNKEPDRSEGSASVVVYFDTDGRVVGKEIGWWID